jgi:hypothetical protein
MPINKIPIIKPPKAPPLDDPDDELENDALDS